jgi:hypothetical protein
MTQHEDSERRGQGNGRCKRQDGAAAPAHGCEAWLSSVRGRRKVKDGSDIFRCGCMHVCRRREAQQVSTSVRE